MTHLTYKRGEPSPHDTSKTVHLTTSSDRTDPESITKVWDVDPQRQIIDLLKDIKKLLEKVAADSVPYHTGPKTVSVADPPSPPEPQPVSQVQPSDSAVVD